MNEDESPCIWVNSLGFCYHSTLDSVSFTTGIRMDFYIKVYSCWKTSFYKESVNNDYLNPNIRHNAVVPQFLHRITVNYY